MRRFWREPKLDEDELKHHNLRQDLCFRENVCVAVNEHNPLAGKGHVELADIAGQPMLTLALDNIFDAEARRSTSLLKDFAPLAERDLRLTLRFDY